MKIYVTQAFKYAFGGHDVRDIPEGEQDVPEKCAAAAFRNGWAKKQATMPENKAVQPKEDKQYPIHTHAGWYELSNGEKVRGKEDAIKAQKELDG